MTYTKKAFWVETADRAVRTFAQGVLGALGTGAVGILQVDWVGALSVGAMAAVVSILTSFATPEKIRADGENTYTARYAAD